MTLDTHPDGIYVPRDDNGEPLGAFYAAGEDRPCWWRVTLPSGLEYSVFGPRTPEDVAATMVRRR